MAHNARIRSDAAWVVGSPVLSGEWLTLDTKLTKSANGDGGGTWTPTSVVTVGGAGMWMFGGAMTLGGTNSRITTTNGVVSIEHDDSDHTQLAFGHTGRTRPITIDFDTAIYVAGWDDQLGPYGSPVSIALGANLIAQLRVHNGATLSTVTFTFVVGSSHGPPVSLPQFRVYALDTKGVRTPLISNGTDGYVPFSPTPASGAAWFAGGAFQSFVYTLSGGGVVIDTSKYSYWAEVIEEQGASALPGNVYLDATCTFALIADVRPQ